MSQATEAGSGGGLFVILAPLAAWALLGAEIGGLVHFEAGPLALIAVALLVASVFGAVHHAEVVAARVGQPFGSVVLALAVTVIEVSLIVAIMLSSAEAALSVEDGAIPPNEVARDTVFAALMIVLNGIVGLCLLIGGLRHREQGFRGQSAAAAIGVLGTLAVLGLVLPNYTLAVPGPYYAPTQLIFVAVTSILLYGLFLFVQTVRHRDDFLDLTGEVEHGPRPGGRAAARSFALLVVALAAVVLLAESLSPAVEAAVHAAGFPGAVVGVVIALVVLLPEGFAAVRAAWSNKAQTSLNLALGSAIASIGLTIPVVAVASLALGLPLALGLQEEHVVLLALTLFVSTLTLVTGRTTVLQGGVHLVIFGAFLTISLVP
jgi:Ca2+:H+ antiporter